ncbi:MAG: RNA-protein complex protein Nop10 [Candidatus Thermoplasmatota archaeon]|jgi:rRNA maturation protein Nop10|nr:RNA-protein complex protein Nop10 [Candidatus Thermoplasmatota archaeon]MCL6091014.1 RNA-protein complex protein Nop10 [Candidatus Thermoplasmatota archaeon]
MLDNCPDCGSVADVALPPRYSPVDKFQRFRIELKKK